MARELLTEEDRQAIAAAIEQAELRTSGEIVFATADAAARYPHATYAGALVAMAAGAALYLALPWPHYISLLLFAELASFALGFAFFSRPEWRRWFVSESEMEARVRQAATLEFYASSLYRTRDANGVLIFLSLLEHRVVVLGDRGIHDRVGERWDEVRDLVLDGIRKGEARRGICAAIARVGEMLEKHFPRRPDDVNELPNAVIDRPLRDR